MNRRVWNLCGLLGLTLGSFLIQEGSACGQSDAAKETRPNFLIITVDDMSCDSVGAFGCPLEGTTPHIDRLAQQSLRYQYAHVQVGNCYPSRNVMFSGRYPHNTGVEGFYQVRDPQYPHLVDLMKQAGYFVGIRGKVSHSTPYQPYAWDEDLTTLDGKKQHVKDPESYYASTKRGIELAGQAGKPFCLNVNVSDPHKPFYAMGKKGEVIHDPYVPSRVYGAEEVPIPGFLFDHPDVRLELAHYYSSVRRADDCVGQILRALRESGSADETVIMFLSDHGMPLPFAKTALWHHSTWTPWIVQWPGVTQGGAVDRQHMISAVDLLPTVLDIAEIDLPEGLDGHSFKPTLLGQSQAGRGMVYKVYNENSGGNRSPMRSVQSRKFGYLFNPWSDGKRIFRTATTGTMSYRAMVKLAESDPGIAARLKLFQHGVPEEFYDYERDPDALVNLIDDPQYAGEIQRHRDAMQAFMEDSKDPLLEGFLQRDRPEVLSAYVDRVQAEADARRAARKKASSATSRQQKKQNQRLFQLELPDSASPGESVTLKLLHQLPRSLGEQSFHVSLKDDSGKRIHRIVKTAAGNGKLEFVFELPQGYSGPTIRFSAFVGDEYAKDLLHRTTDPIPVAR